MPLDDALEAAKTAALRQEAAEILSRLGYVNELRRERKGSGELAGELGEDR